MTVIKKALCVWLTIQAHVEVIRCTDQEFQVLPKRWVVERTFGWLNQYRRLSKDYEHLSLVICLLTDSKSKISFIYRLFLTASTPV